MYKNKMKGYMKYVEYGNYHVHIQSSSYSYILIVPLHIYDMKDNGARFLLPLLQKA